MDITVLSSGSHGNAYQIAVGMSRLLVEAGLPVRQLRQGMGFQLHAVDGVLISHAHGDHSASAGAVALTWWCRV